MEMGHRRLCFENYLEDNVGSFEVDCGYFRGLITQKINKTVRSKKIVGRKGH